MYVLNGTLPIEQSIHKTVLAVLHSLPCFHCNLQPEFSEYLVLGQNVVEPLILGSSTKVQFLSCSDCWWCWCQNFWDHHHSPNSGASTIKGLGQKNLPLHIPQYIQHIQMLQIHVHHEKFESKLVGGWPTPLKNDGVNVSWDDFSIPNMMGKS